MNGTLKDLGNEYEESIHLQSEIIARNREKLKAARAKCNFKEIKRLNSLLRVLYEEKSELERTAHDINQYYS